MTSLGLSKELFGQSSPFEGRICTECISPCYLNSQMCIFDVFRNYIQINCTDNIMLGGLTK